jgi:hypothetical protein
MKTNNETLEDIGRVYVDFNDMKLTNVEPGMTTLSCTPAELINGCKRLPLLTLFLPTSCINLKSKVYLEASFTSAFRLGMLSILSVF